MYKYKSYNYYNNMALNYNILYLYNLLRSNTIIIFVNIQQFTNKNFLNFKYNITKLNVINLILKSEHIKLLFQNAFTFLSAHIYCIFMNDINKFIEIINILNNINFYFSYRKRFSNIVNNINIVGKINKKLYNLHYFIYKIIFNIIIILLYFILNFTKYLK